MQVGCCGLQSSDIVCIGLDQCGECGVKGLDSGGERNVVALHRIRQCGNAVLKRLLIIGVCLGKCSFESCDAIFKGFLVVSVSLFKLCFESCDLIGDRLFTCSVGSLGIFNCLIRCGDLAFKLSLVSL